ncbi:MAG: Hpt domain-containing protein, partial [Pseudomonadota bacterium]
GADDFAEVVEIFLEEVDGTLDRLKSEGGSPGRDDFHFLKGSAMNLGFEAMGVLCQDGEMRAAAGETGLELAPVLDVYEQSKKAFLAEL